MILNNGKLIKSKISRYPRLKTASSEQLNKWNLISQGIGIHWEELDEDLSIKGFIKDVAINNALNKLQSSGTEEIFSKQLQDYINYHFCPNKRKYFNFAIGLI